ncbi:MAG: hypothetical protein HY880_06835 [Deltaproteobacteria bacterium]|nr:hypothetical protein [Deltaproteobacteria bacterium]
MKNKLKVLTVFGTRPEAIKLAPVIRRLEKEPDAFTSVVCVTAPTACAETVHFLC